MVYWDYSSKPRRKRSKVWAKSTAPSKRDAQRLADQFMERVNARRSLPSCPESPGQNPEALVEGCKSWPGMFSLQHHELLTKNQVFQEQLTTGCETNIGSLLRRAKRHSPCNVGIALSLSTSTPYVVEITGAQTFGGAGTVSAEGCLNKLEDILAPQGDSRASRCKCPVTFLRSITKRGIDFHLSSSRGRDLP